jgi:hypothetical protein
MTSLRQRVPLASLSADDCDGVIVVSLCGELDFASCPVLQTFLSDILGPERATCVVDLTGLTLSTVLVSMCSSSTAWRPGHGAAASPWPDRRAPYAGSCQSPGC